jgi:hypothetical protein
LRYIFQVRPTGLANDLGEEGRMKGDSGLRRAVKRRYPVQRPHAWPSLSVLPELCPGGELLPAMLYPVTAHESLKILGS